MKKYANLIETAAHCGVCWATLRHYIDRYPDFPVRLKCRGRNGWRIDLKAVDRWREKTGHLTDRRRKETEKLREMKQEVRELRELLRFLDYLEKEDKKIQKMNSAKKNYRINSAS